MTEEQILEVIKEWKYFWLNQRQNSQRDYEFYRDRAMGIDANMQHHLADMLHKKLEAFPADRGNEPIGNHRPSCHIAGCMGQCWGKP